MATKRDTKCQERRSTAQRLTVARLCQAAQRVGGGDVQSLTVGPQKIWLSLPFGNRIKNVAAGWKHTAHTHFALPQSTREPGSPVLNKSFI